MNAHHCRIGRVRMKGGATVTPLRAAERDELQRTLVRHASMIAGYYGPGEMDGFFIVAWNRKGEFSNGLRLSPDGVVGPTLLPAWIADIARRALIESREWAP